MPQAGNPGLAVWACPIRGDVIFVDNVPASPNQLVVALGAERVFILPDSAR